jgi:hypothetical protein
MDWWRIAVNTYYEVWLSNDTAFYVIVPQRRVLSFFDDVWGNIRTKQTKLLLD